MPTDKTTQHLCQICAAAIGLAHRDRIGGTLEGPARCDDCGTEGPLNEYQIKKGGLSREWLLKMADAEDAAGSVSVGGLTMWECTHCGSDILPGGTCGHCGINDGDEKFKSELSHMMVRLILCLPMDHHLRDEATQWLLKRGLIVEGVAEAMKL